MRLKVHDFRKGLWIVSGKEQILPGYVRRARGMHAIRKPSLQSRWGTTQLYALNAHSLARFNDVRFQGVGNNLYRNGISIYSGFNGGRLAFPKMPPQVALFDSLFVAGGGALVKVDTGGNVSNWGIAPPAVDFTVADGGAGAMLAGTYQYLVVFKNSSTGSRSNPNTNARSITIGASHQVNLSALPLSGDTQVDQREIYRTQQNGAKFFLLHTIADNTTTTYTDNNLDTALGVQEVQLDNIPPTALMNDAWGPYAGRMWWGRDSTSLGTGGRVYYSPEARPEAVTSFIDLVNPDDKVQKGLVWNEQNWVFVQSGIFRISGNTEPFSKDRVGGAPGTFFPYTVKGTPYGIAYCAYDGVRLFDGNVAPLIGFDALGPLLRGESLENLNAFTPLIAEYAHDEYYISDGVSQTIAINLRDGSWRDLGIGLTALLQEHNTTNLIGSFNSKVGILEDPTVVTDMGGAIPIEWEIGGALTDIAQRGVIKRIFIDINTNNQALTPALVLDGTVVNYATIQTSGRSVIEWSPNKDCRLFSLRLTGSLTQQVELFGIELEVYTPRELDIGNQALLSALSSAGKVPAQ